MKAILLALLVTLTPFGALRVQADEPNKSFLAQAIGVAGPEIVDFPLPANWQRKEAPGMLMFIRAADAESGLKVVFRLKTEPKTGTLAETYLGLWPRLIKGLFPNEPMENKMVPLVIRNSKGVKIAFDGDGLRKNPYSIMLYLVDVGDSVIPFVGVFASEPVAASITMATSTEPSAPAKELAFAVDAIALKTGKSADGPLFDTAKLLGAYSRAGVGSMASYRSTSGDYLGDASTGLSEDIEFKANGSYAEQFVPVINGRAQEVEKRIGTWKLEGHNLTVHFGDGKTPDKKWVLMGLGSNRKGDRFVAYLIDPRFTDKWFIEMFRQGADMNTYYYTRKQPFN